MWFLPNWFYMAIGSVFFMFSDLEIFSLWSAPWYFNWRVFLSCSIACIACGIIYIRRGGDFYA